MALCQQALAHGPKTTRELAKHVMATKGLDTGDKVLARSIAQTMVHMLRMRHHRGLLVMDSKRHGVSVWRMPAAPELL